MPGVCTMKEFSSSKPVYLLKSGFSGPGSTQTAARPEAFAASVKSGPHAKNTGLHIIRQGLLNRTHIVSQSAFQTNSSFDSFGNASANIFMPHLSEQHLLQSFRQISEIPTLPVDLHLEKKMDDFFETIKKQPVKLHSRRS